MVITSVFRKKNATVAVLLVVLSALASAQKNAVEGPTNEKAQKTYGQAVEYANKHMIDAALEGFKKADKQDSGHCVGCKKNIMKYGVARGDWKAAESAAEQLLAQAQVDNRLALAHFDFGFVLLQEALSRGRDEIFARAHEELAQAITAAPKFSTAIYADGLALAHLKQDDAAKARFQQFISLKPENELDLQRATLYLARPEMARAKMAPPFALTTKDGQRISMDELKGKVVLLDFWATWCAPCRDAVPQIRDIARKFKDQPLYVLSVSLDTDEQKWKEFVAKNQMVWPQYRDGGFNGPLATMFGVNAIPHTFTIDADGVLQDEQIGDLAIEGKLKKLVARAQELQLSGKKN